MGSQTQTQPHILVLPYTIQGHINPMLQFSKRLASKGARVTLVATTSISESVKAIASHTINVEIISDGSTESKTFDSSDSEEYFEHFIVTVSQSMTKLIIQNIEPTSYSILPPSPLSKNENSMLPITGIRNKFETFTYENFDGHGVYGFLFIYFF